LINVGGTRYVVVTLMESTCATGSLADHHRAQFGLSAS
jgi:hypothetical protein